MERTSLHNDSLLYASLIAILLLISYWFTTRCFKIISGIEGTGLGTWGPSRPLHKPGGGVTWALGVGERHQGPFPGAPRCPPESLGHLLSWSCCVRAAGACCGGVRVPPPRAVGWGCRQHPGGSRSTSEQIGDAGGPNLCFWALGPFGHDLHLGSSPAVLGCGRSRGSQFCWRTRLRWDVHAGCVAR